MSTANQAIGLNGRLAARWARRAVDRLRKERVEIDELNVFPVPDGDTGTNMYHTLRSAYLAVEELTGLVTLPQVVAALADGAGRGARGNSGLILAVALQGVADALDGVTVATPNAMAAALELASERARKSVGRPVDGTMLTVLDAMATQAREMAESGANLIELISSVRLRSRSALRETTGQLSVLREAEVVDAGSTGIVELFDLLYATVTGRTPQDSMLGEITGSPRIVHQAGADELEIVATLATDPASIAPVSVAPGSAAAEGPASPLAEALDALGGTSIVINGAKVHVHVADEATAVTVLDHLAGFGIVRLDMEDLRLHEEEGETHLVAIVQGTGLLMHCALNGATALTPGSGDVVRVTNDIIAEEEREVLVIPSSTTALRLLGSVAGGRVVRSRNVATLLSALAVYDPFAPAGEIFADMTEAAAGTRVGTIASLEQLALDPHTEALPTIDDSRRIPRSHPSQFYRVFIDGKVKTQSTELTTLVEKLADRLLGAGGELLTLVHGPGCPPDVLDSLREWIRKSHAQVRFQDIDSRDRATLIIMGVE
ncbi:DAK2 domain-containing protein [Brevibacterium marinum]|uniref:DhaL domain-containing protein n=1 Tax=Brevibacterium marinum TaxID=418643 RepID=A0A846S7Q7_9MICO|nr:DAK2 domain-containing protein [Brevibacterium marinum]NJC56857.1 hypothetical protein [Brevibacterium marinum]